MANRDKEYETTSARARSAASGIMSATSRKSTQVAPQPDEASRITPVEQSTDLNDDIESPTPTAKERPRSNFCSTSYSNRPCKRFPWEFFFLHLCLLFTENDLQFFSKNEIWVSVFHKRQKRGFFQSVNLNDFFHSVSFLSLFSLAVFKEPSATSTESGAVAAKPVAVAKGCKCSANHPCAWHHSSNALWRELENSPYNKRKNKEVAMHAQVKTRQSLV